MIGRLLAMMLVMAVTAGPALAGEVMPPPAETDKCPVCGMFVKPYPEWTAAVVYRDGHAHYFDGAKDLFKFLHSPQSFTARHQADQVMNIFVTEYYGVTPIDARKALFVISSDVYGPMGRELIPLATDADAAEFIRDHGGSVLRFDDITPERIKPLN